MKIGTLSVLVGVHQFLWHPITVVLAWRKLYHRWPTWWETIAIICHDLGYVGKPNMDGPEGEKHPEFGAWLTYEIVFYLGHDVALAEQARLFSLLHSRYYSASHGMEPSLLCWADKLSIWYDPRWFYLLRAKLSGEIREYRTNAIKYVPKWVPDGFWFDWHRKRVIEQVRLRLPASAGHHLDE